MSLKNIYYELSKHYDADYYTKLAKSNAMVVPVLIDIISDEYFEFDKRQAEMILENISQTDSELVYPILTIFVIWLIEKKTQYFGAC